MLSFLLGFLLGVLVSLALLLLAIRQILRSGSRSAVARVLYGSAIALAGRFRAPSPERKPEPLPSLPPAQPALALPLPDGKAKGARRTGTTV